MGFQIVWTDPARETLQTIVQRIRADNPAAAQRFVAELVRRVELAAQMPHAASLFARRRGLEIREFMHGVYRVFYRVRPRLKQVEILVIWHSAREEPKLKRR